MDVFEKIVDAFLEEVAELVVARLESEMPPALEQLIERVVKETAGSSGAPEPGQRKAGRKKGTRKRTEKPQEAPQEPEQAPEPTLDDVRASLREFAASHDRDEALALLQEHGDAQSVSSLDAAKIPAVLEAIKAASA